MSHYHHPSSNCCSKPPGGSGAKRRMRAVWLGAVEERRRTKGCRVLVMMDGGDGDDVEPCGVGYVMYRTDSWTC